MYLYALPAAFTGIALNRNLSYGPMVGIGQLVLRDVDHEPSALFFIEHIHLQAVPAVANGVLGAMRQSLRDLVPPTAAL